MPLSPHDRTVIELILRSEDEGDGWRKVNPTIWKITIEPFQAKELLELNIEDKMVRLSEKGKTVSEYM